MCAAKVSPAIAKIIVRDAGGLDTPAADLVAALSKQTAGFTTDDDDFFMRAVVACRDNESETGQAPVTTIRVVGRSLGSQGLFGQNHSDSDPSVTRRLAAFFYQGVPAFVGFRPEVDANGKATPYGRYEFLIARNNPKLSAKANDEYSDFFVVESHSKAPAYALSVPVGTCTSCHQDGMPIFSVYPWSEADATLLSEVGTRSDFDSIVDTMEHRIRGIRVMSWLSDHDFVMRKLVVLSLLTNGNGEFDSWDALVTAAIGGRTFTTESSRLVSRRPEDKVPFQSYVDPLVPRPLKLWLSNHPAQDLAHEFWRSGLVSYRGAASMNQALAGREQEFLDSRVLAESVLKKWPPTEHQLLETVRAFATNSSPAEVSLYQARLDRRSPAPPRAAVQDPPNGAPPQTVAEAFTQYCSSCHEDGQAPFIDKDHLLLFHGKYDPRTVPVQLATTMPPLGAPQPDPAAAALLRAAVGPATELPQIISGSFIAGQTERTFLDLPRPAE